MLGATKANYLQPGNRNGAGQSELSPLPCKNYANGACHHDYAALDMGLRKKMIDGHEFTPNDFPEISKKYPSPYLYYSVGVKILAITDGTITSYKPYGSYRRSRTTSLRNRNTISRTFSSRNYE